MTDVEGIVQSNLDAYNQRDIDQFMAVVSDEITLITFGESQASLVGKEAIRIAWSHSSPYVEEFFCCECGRGNLDGLVCYECAPRCRCQRIGPKNSTCPDCDAIFE